MSAKVVPIPRDISKLPAADLTNSELGEQIGSVNFKYEREAKPIVDRREELHKEARSRCENKSAIAETLFEGEIWTTKVGERSFVTVLPTLDSIHRMFRSAKKDFYAAASITIKAMEEALGESAVEKVKRKEQTGYRKVTSFLRVEPTKAG